MSYSVTNRALLTKFNKRFQRVVIENKKAEIEELYHLNCSTMGIDEAVGLRNKSFNVCDLSIHIIERKERLQRKIEVFKQANEDVDEAFYRLGCVRTIDAILHFQKYGKKLAFYK